MSKQRIGGSFAPPLTDELMERYGQLIDTVTDPQVKDIMSTLYRCAATFRETGPSKLTGQPHPVGVGTIIPLEDAEIDRIWDVVPWGWECDAMAKVLAEMSDGGPTKVIDPSVPKGYRMQFADPAAAELRNAAHHLLWYARELTQDREPITSDKLSP